jgi:hypothetical protein
VTHQLGLALGGLVPIFLLSWLLRKFVLAPVESGADAVLPVILAYAVVIPIAAMGMADGGEPAFGDAAGIYGLPALVVGATSFLWFKFSMRRQIDG